MKVNVRLGGMMSSRCNWHEREFLLEDGTTITALKNTIESEGSGIDFATLRALATVNRQIVPDEQRLNDGDEISFIPPLAGG